MASLPQSARHRNSSRSEELAPRQGRPAACAPQGVRGPDAPHAQARLIPVCQVTFRAATYQPVSLLAPYDPTPVDRLAFDARARGMDLVLPESLQTLGDVAQFILDNGLQLFGRPTRRNSRIGRCWAGQYRITLAKEAPQS